MSRSGPAAPPEDPTSVGILRLAGPLIVSFWVRAGFTLVDLFYAAELEQSADASIGAIGLTAPFEFMMIACWVGSSNGLTARLAAAMGAGEGERIEQLKRAALRIVAGLAVLFLALAAGIWFLAPRIVDEPLLAGQFRIYAAILLGGSAFTAFWSILPDSIVKAHQDTRSTMWAGLLSGSTNLVLNTVFVFVFHWGIAGIALSTVLGRLAGLLYALTRARHHERLRRAAGRDVEPGTFEHPLRAILVLALPASITFLFLSAETFVLYRLILRLEEPTPAAAAWTIFDQVTRFMSMPPIAIGVALLPLTARLWGRGEMHRIRDELRVAFRAVVLYVALVVAPLGLLLGPSLAGFLAETDEARRFATLGLRWMPLAVLAGAPTFLMRSCFEGMQRPRPGLVTSILRSVLLVVPLAILGIAVAPALGFVEIAGAYAGFTAGAAAATAFLFVWLRAAIAGEARPGAEVGSGTAR